MGNSPRTVEEWDGEKAKAAARAIEVLAEHYEIMSRALKRQATTLQQVTALASTIIEATTP